jgi:hypothetical protein
MSSGIVGGARSACCAQTFVPVTARRRQRAPLRVCPWQVVVLAAGGASVFVGTLR